MWHTYKYLLAYILPFAALLGLFLGGFWALGAFVFAFLILPILEQILPINAYNLPENIRAKRAANPFFNLLLYINLPLLYFIVGYFFYGILQGYWTNAVLVMQSLSVGVVLGVIGINVAHELGHRTEKQHQITAHFLLLPALYQHFFVEHNRGHHKNVGTDRDPSSAKKGENIYAFWVRSVWGTYKSAWELETERLQKRKINFWSLENLMLRFTAMEVLYLCGLYFFGGFFLVGCGIFIAIVAFLLLESVNYIEHYGLRRKQLSNGKYEKVKPHHSWNSEHELGRIVLYELTRHSDHHYMESIKYQNLKYQAQSPQLPFGYPTSILLALVPPLWFKLMDNRLAAFETT